MKILLGFTLNHQFFALTLIKQQALFKATNEIVKITWLILRLDLTTDE